MRILLTVLAVLALLVAAVLTGIYSGAYDVAADQPEGGVAHWLLETTQERSVRAAAEGIVAPSLTEPGRIETGAHHFAAMCETCHGAPGVEPSEIGKGLNPKPPELSHAAEEWEPEEMFWMVKHGIKMTGMPAFGKTHGDEELWSIVAFVRQLPEMSPAQYQAWTGGAGGGHGHAHAAGDQHAEEARAEARGDDQPGGEEPGEEHTHERDGHAHEGDEHGESDPADPPRGSARPLDDRPHDRASNDA